MRTHNLKIAFVDDLARDWLLRTNHEKLWVNLYSGICFINVLMLNEYRC